MTRSFQTKPFQGAITALMVPLFNDGQIDNDSLIRLLEYQVENGINGVLSGGTTGQSPTMHNEQREINQLVVNRVGGRVPVIVGAGSYDTKKAVEDTKHAMEDGASATLHVMGYYNRPPQLGVIDYFKKVAEATSIPVIMYNIPPRGAAEYKPETMVYLARKHSNIIGVKEASGEPALVVARRTRELADKHELPKFLILSGDDDKTYVLMSDETIKGDGVISVMSNLLPHAYTQLTRLLLAGKLEDAKELNEVLTPLNGMVSVRGSYAIQIDNQEYTIENDTFRNPAPVHAAAYILGMIKLPMLRSPLISISEHLYDAQTVFIDIARRLIEIYEVAPELFNPIRQFYKVDVGRKLEAYKPYLNRVSSF